MESNHELMITNQLLYRLTIGAEIGAGRENRTPIIRLVTFCNTIILYPLKLVSVH